MQVLRKDFANETDVCKSNEFSDVHTIEIVRIPFREKLRLILNRVERKKHV